MAFGSHRRRGGTNEDRELHLSIQLVQLKTNHTQAMRHVTTRVDFPTLHEKESPFFSWLLFSRADYFVKCFPMVGDIKTVGEKLSKERRLEVVRGARLHHGRHSTLREKRYLICDVIVRSCVFEPSFPRRGGVTRDIIAI